MEFKDLNKEEDPFEGLIPGRIVHYNDGGRHDNPAIITRVHSKDSINRYACIDLVYWDQSSCQCVAYSSCYEDIIPDAPGTWHWPRDPANSEAPHRAREVYRVANYFEDKIKSIPTGEYTATRYDTDDTHVLHLYNKDGESYDLIAPKEVGT